MRADAARAIGRIGTPAGLSALYGALFGNEGRTRRYAPDEDLEAQAAAIANAMNDAIGVRVTDAPLTPKQLLQQLAAQPGRLGRDLAGPRQGERLQVLVVLQRGLLLATLGDE